MAFSSSPVQYPATSSPREGASPRKRRRTEGREPLKDLPDNVQRPETQATFGGFIDEDDSEDESPLGRLSEEKTAPSLSAHIPSIDELENTTSTKPIYDERHDSGCEITSSPPALRSIDEDVNQQPLLSSKVLYTARTSSGRRIPIRQRRTGEAVHYSAILAARSTTAPGRAQKSYYGIDIHALVDEGKATLESRQHSVTIPEEVVVPTVEALNETASSRKTHLWTEKYRPRKFTDLIGDERTHRSVLRWLKGWDHTVFPSQNPKAKARPAFNRDGNKDNTERPHRKILLLTGPAGLGKTTLAHVCARQAGYETHEINASDERTKDVVKGRIRDMVGTENVRSVESTNNKKNASKPICVVVDEVDGVVAGSNAGGGGEGGFIKGLLDLLATDYKNANRRSDPLSKGKRKGDNFRMLRPIILICNDVYHPSLRLLRHGPHAEVIHVRKPALAMVVPRLCAIFNQEGVPADGDGVRTLCETAWGVTSKRQGGKGSAGGGQGEGDIRSILVACEWVAGKIRAAALAGLPATTRLTRRWIETNVVSEMAHGGGMAKTLGRGGTREVVERVFKHNAGFAATVGPASTKRKTDEAYGKEAAIGVSEAVKRGTMSKLREMVESSGEDEKILLDCFQTYPSHPYQDTTRLTKPSSAYDWLHFSSLCSHLVHSNQDWELAPYLSYPVLAFHNLFASSSSQQQHNHDTSNANDNSSETTLPHPLTTNRADSHAHETARGNTATLTHLQTQLSLPLQRSFRSHASLATELIPYTLRILNPAVKPVLVGGVSSVRRGEERERVEKAVSAMQAVGLRFDKGRVDLRDPENVEGGGGPGATEGKTAASMLGRDNGGWVYRLEPPLDELGTFPMFDGKSVLGGWEGDAGKARYALRQVLAQGHEAAVKTAEADARARRSGGVTSAAVNEDTGTGHGGQIKALEQAKKRAKAAVKRDFFGREIVATTASGDAVATDEGVGKGIGGEGGGKGGPRIWASYHEGFSNAVRKPITMKELMEGL